MFPPTWEGEKARVSALVVDSPCCFSSCVWRSSDEGHLISLRARGGKQENDCERLLPILFCSVLRYPFFGPLGGQLSRTTQLTPEVAQAVH